MELVWRDAYTNAIVIYQDKVAPHNFGEGIGIMRILLPRLSGLRARGRNLGWGCITTGLDIITARRAGSFRRTVLCRERGIRRHTIGTPMY